MAAMQQTFHLPKTWACLYLNWTVYFNHVIKYRIQKVSSQYWRVPSQCKFGAADFNGFNMFWKNQKKVTKAKNNAVCGSCL